MTSYLPNKPTPRPWNSEAQFPAARQHSRMGPVSSGSSRNLQRGYLGAPETNVGSALVGLLRTNANRFMFYKTALEHVDKIDHDVQSLGEHGDPGGPPSLGAPHPSSPARPGRPGGVGPHVRTDADGNQLALNPGARPMPGPKPPLALNPGPRVHKMGTSEAPRPIEQQFPDLLSGPGPSRGSTLGNSEAPSARQPGRRTPAGLDPRKRGTWLPLPGTPPKNTGGMFDPTDRM